METAEIKQQCFLIFESIPILYKILNLGYLVAQPYYKRFLPLFKKCFKKFKGISILKVNYVNNN